MNNQVLPTVKARADRMVIASGKAAIYRPPAETNVLMRPWPSLGSLHRVCSMTFLCVFSDDLLIAKHPCLTIVRRVNIGFEAAIFDPWIQGLHQNWGVTGRLVSRVDSVPAMRLHRMTPRRWMNIAVIGVVIFGFHQSRRSQMARSANDRRARAAWARIEALGGHGVWEPDMCVVSLARTAVTDEDLSLFRDFPYVHILDLSHTAIGDAGLIHLDGLMALEGLDLSRTRTGDAGLAHLARLAALQELTVIDTKISDAGLDAFRRARPAVRITTEPPPKGAINPFTGKPWSEGGAEP